MSAKTLVGTCDRTSPHAKIQVPTNMEQTSLLNYSVPRHCTPLGHLDVGAIDDLHMTIAIDMQTTSNFLAVRLDRHQ